MRKVFLITLLFLVIGLSKSFAQYEGTLGLGVHTGYAKEINSLGGGFHAHYYYTNNLRFAPSYTHYIPTKSREMWEIDADAHYLLPLNWEFSFYPIGGLHFSKWKFNAENNREFEQFDWKKNRIGLNLGVGFQYDFRYKTRANLEIKYQSIKDFSQLSLMIGVGFWI